MLQFLPIALAAISALSSMSNTAKGAKQTDAERAQIQAMANRDRLLKAYLDPNDVITKNLMAGENKELNNSMQQGISNLLAANRKARLMGRQTFFNPERQDESISQYLNKSVDTRNSVARSNALQRILNAVNGYGSSATGYGGMIENQQNQQNTNNSRAPSLFAAGSDAFQSGGSLANLFSMLSKGGGGNVADLGSKMPWLTGAS